MRKFKISIFILVLALCAMVSTEPASAACTNTTTVPTTVTTNCKREWCTTAPYGYKGCGWGNGDDCSERKSCPAQM